VNEPALGRTLGFIDLGTNSVRLLLVRVAQNGATSVLSQQKEVVRLGEGEFIEGTLQPEAMQRAILVARTFADMARTYGAEEVVAIATSATREARNQADFVRRLRQEADLAVRVVSGREEARLIYLGVASGVHLNGDAALFVDIGGGSTELIVGDHAQHHHLDSLRLGALRLTSLFFLPGETGPVADDRYALIRRYVENSAVRTVQQLRAFPFQRAIGSSGTIENLADMAVRMAHRRERTREDVLTRAQLAEVVAALCAAPLEERRRLPGINPARADIIVAGAAILEALMDMLGVAELQITDRGLREGVLVDHLAQAHPGALEGSTVRERSVLQLGRRCNIDEPHARTVARLALGLFDDARALGLHDQGDDARELLGHAAMLHDVGAFLAYHDHHKHSAYVIRNADLLGFDQAEVAFIAALARFHRKAPPRRKRPELAALDKPFRRAVQPLAALLRLAESLDRSHAALVEEARFHPMGGKRLALDIRCARDCPLELWGVQSQAAAFKRAFGRVLVGRVVAEEGPPEGAAAHRAVEAVLRGA